MGGRGAAAPRSRDIHIHDFTIPPAIDHKKVQVTDNYGIKYEKKEGGWYAFEYPEQNKLTIGWGSDKAAAEKAIEEAKNAEHVRQNTPKGLAIKAKREAGAETGRKIIARVEATRAAERQKAQEAQAQKEREHRESFAVQNVSAPSKPRGMTTKAGTATAKQVALVQKLMMEGRNEGISITGPRRLKDVPKMSKAAASLYITAMLNPAGEAY